VSGMTAIAAAKPPMTQVRIRRMTMASSPD
jgi:hypothetical protein